MIGIGLHIGNRVMGGGGGFDVDAQAFFDRVTVAGGTLTTTEKNATNQLVLDMKSAGIWSSMKAVYPMVGSSAAACAQNLKSSSFTGTFSSGWTFASTGITGNGLTNYMQTNLNMSTQLPTGANVGFYGRTNFTGPSTYPVAWDASASPIFNYLGGIQYQDSYFGTTATLIQDQSGYVGFFQRSATTGVQNRRLGNVSKGTQSNNYTAANANLTLCYPVANTQTNSEIAFFSAGDYITTAQQDTFYTAVQTFNQTLNRQVGAQIVSDADAQAYINRVYTAGGTLTNTEANAVNQLVIDMKGAGIWTAMKAVYPMVGASAAACAQNLKSSSFTGTFTSGWTFESTGVTGNGSSTFMQTAFILSSNLSVNSVHASLYLNTNNVPTVGDPVDLGAFVGVTQALTLNQSSLASLIFGSRNVGNFISTTQATRLGFGLSSKTSATLTTLYKNGTSVASGNSGGTLPNIQSYLGALNLSGGQYGVINNRIAFHSLGDGLTDTQAANFYTAVQIFNTTLGRQVAG